MLGKPYSTNGNIKSDLDGFYRSGCQLIYQLLIANKRGFMTQAFLSIVIAGLHYVPAWFLQQFIQFLELTRNPTESYHIDDGWGWVYCAGLFLSSMAVPGTLVFLKFVVCTID